MFKIVKERRVWWPVQFNQSDDDGGTVTQVTIEMRFLLKGVDDALPLIAAAEALDTTGEGSLSARFAKFAMGIVDGWRGVGGDNDEALPFSEANLVHLMNVPGVFPAMLGAFRDAITGVGEVRSKN